MCHCGGWHKRVQWWTVRVRSYAITNKEECKRRRHVVSHTQSTSEAQCPIEFPEMVLGASSVLLASEAIKASSALVASLCL